MIQANRAPRYISYPLWPPGDTPWALGERKVCLRPHKGHGLMPHAIIVIPKSFSAPWCDDCVVVVRPCSSIYVAAGIWRSGSEFIKLRRPPGCRMLEFSFFLLHGFEILQNYCAVQNSGILLVSYSCIEDGLVLVHFFSFQLHFVD